MPVSCNLLVGGRRLVDCSVLSRSWEHRAARITALEWDLRGRFLVSGDSRGKVACFDVSAAADAAVAAGQGAASVIHAQSKAVAAAAASAAKIAASAAASFLGGVMSTLGGGAGSGGEGSQDVASKEASAQLSELIVTDVRASVKPSEESMAASPPEQKVSDGSARSAAVNSAKSTARTPPPVPAPSCEVLFVAESPITQLDFGPPQYTRTPGAKPGLLLISTARRCIVVDVFAPAGAVAVQVSVVGML